MGDCTPATYEEVLTRWPTARRAPRADCKFCRGTGTKQRKKDDGTISESPCLCIFVEHNLVDDTAAALSASAKRLNTPENREKIVQGGLELIEKLKEAQRDPEAAKRLWNEVQRHRWLKEQRKKQ